MRNPRTWAWLMAVFAVSYAALAMWRGWFLLTSQDATLIVFGVAIIVIPLLGLWMIWRELDFGFAMQRMGQDMAELGVLPQAGAPSSREDAQDQVTEAMEAVARDQADWRAWYRLGLAHDQARQRKPARVAMRQARALSPYAR